MIPLNVLLLEDDPADAELILDTLRAGGFEPAARHVENERDFRRGLSEAPQPDLILADYSLPQFDGLRALLIVRAAALDIPFILVSGTVGEDVAVSAIRQGAADYLLKDRLARLGSAVAQALAQKQLRTEKNAAEQALRESELRHRALIENSTDAITLVTVDGRVLYNSPATDRILGVQSPPGAHSGWLAQVHPDDLPQVSRAFAAVAAVPGSHTTSTFRYRHMNGSWLWLEGSGLNLLAEPGVGAIVLNYRDVTARRQSEEQVRTQAQILQNVHDCIIVMDLDGKITFWNEGATQLLGYAPHEMLGRTSDSLYVSQESWDLATMFRRALDGADFAGEGQMRRKDGCLIWVDAETRLMRDGEARPVGLLAIARDISERKRAEEALRQSETRYRVLVEQAADGIFITDAQGRYLDVNGSGCAMLGYSRDELLGKDYTLILGAADIAQDPPNFGQLLGGKSLVRERVYRRKDGTLVAVEISSKSLSDGRVQSIVRDIGDRKRAEEDLRRRLAELESLHIVSIALRTARSRGEALPILLDQALAALNTDTGAIVMYHSNSDELYTSVARGWLQNFPKSPLKPGQGIAGSVYSTGRPHITAEFAADALVAPEMARQSPLGWGGVCVPVRAGPLVVGVFFIAVPAARPIDPEQVKLLESLAEMGGAALHRMRLHEETERQLEHVQALHQIDQAISSSVDMRINLAIVLEQVKSQLRVDAADVLLLNPATQTLEYKAGVGFRTRAVQSARIRLGVSLAGRSALERRTVHSNHPAQLEDSPLFAELCAGERFTAYDCVPLTAKGDVKGVLEVYHRTAFEPDREWSDFLETLGGQAAIAIDSAQLFENLQRSNVDLSLAYNATIEGWSRALDLRDKETEGHTQRVTELTVQLSRAMGLSEPEIVHIRRGTLLHDIGKMGVPDSILLKPGALSDDEWVIMRKHPQYAHDMLAPIAYLHPALDIPYCHHEKWNGTGYPRGLQGEQIPLAARLFAVIDVWDALRSDRPYRLAWRADKVRAHIEALSGSHFDPRAVTEFFDLLDVEAVQPIQSSALPRLLIVDDEVNITRTLARSLRDDFQIFTANSGAEALAILAREEIAIVLTDQRMPGMTGLELLAQIDTGHPHTLCLLLSGYADSAALSATLRLGAIRGYVPKPWNPDQLKEQLGMVAREVDAQLRPVEAGSDPSAGK